MSARAAIAIETELICSAPQRGAERNFGYLVRAIRIFQFSIGVSSRLRFEAM